MLEDFEVIQDYPNVFLEIPRLPPSRVANFKIGLVPSKVYLKIRILDGTYAFRRDEEITAQAL